MKEDKPRGPSRTVTVCISELRLSSEPSFQEIKVLVNACFWRTKKRAVFLGNRKDLIYLLCCEISQAGKEQARLHTHAVGELGHLWLLILECSSGWVPGWSQAVSG